MKYFCLLILLLFYSCSTKVPEHLYKIHTNCLTEENAIDVANAYWTHECGKDNFKIEEYDIKIVERDDTFYIEHSMKEKEGYTVRGGLYTIEISKKDCSIVYKRIHV